MNRGRRGGQTLELALILPILVAFLAGIMDMGWFGLRVYAGHTAAAEAARRVSMASVDSDLQTVAEARALEVLTALNVQVADVIVTTDTRTDSSGNLILEVLVRTPHEGLTGLVPLPDSVASVSSVWMHGQGG